MGNTITEDGITVDSDGADEIIVALWEGGHVTAGNTRQMCMYMRDETDSEAPAAVYLRYGGELTPAIVQVSWRAHDDHVVVVISRPGVVIARGSYPVPRHECIPCTAETAPHTCL